jgi:hypothetical protein
MREIATRRRFERAPVNILPHNATSAPAPPSFDSFYSAPFFNDEFIAVRDEPDGPFYVAKATAVAVATIAVHYHGSTNPDTSRAKFLPCWHLPGTDSIRRSALNPENMIPHSGSLDINSLDVLLVARGLLFAATAKLRVKSQRLLAPQLEELFLF